MPEQLLSTPEELVTAQPEGQDTELHWMPGPTISTPEWILESWKKAAATREATGPAIQQG